MGSYSYDMTKMLFRVSRLTFIQKQSIILDYSISIRNLREIDKIFLAGALGNYSLAGFEMVNQKTMKTLVVSRVLKSLTSSWIGFMKALAIHYSGFHQKQTRHTTMKDGLSRNKSMKEKKTLFHHFLSSPFLEPRKACNVLHNNLLFAIGVICSRFMDFILNPSRHSAR